MNQNPIISNYSNINPTFITCTQWNSSSPISRKIHSWPGKDATQLESASLGKNSKSMPYFSNDTNKAAYRAFHLTEEAKTAIMAVMQKFYKRKRRGARRTSFRWRGSRSKKFLPLAATIFLQKEKKRSAFRKTAKNGKTGKRKEYNF